MFYYIHIYCRNTYPKGRALMKMYRVVPLAPFLNTECTFFCRYVKLW